MIGTCSNSRKTYSQPTNTSTHTPSGKTKDKTRYAGSEQGEKCPHASSSGPLLFLAYAVVGGYFLGTFWRDVSLDPSWKTWLFWPQFGADAAPHLTFTVLGALAARLPIEAIVGLLDRRDTIAGRDPYPDRTTFWDLTSAAAFLLLHAVGAARSITTPTADEHDLLIQARADLTARRALPHPAALSERTAIPIEVCQKWVENGRYWDGEA